MGKINKKDLAIDFNAEDYLGRIITLNAYKNEKVLLSFFRGASCPFCNLRINQLIKEYPEFKKRNIKIITIFAATKEEIQTYTKNQNAPFPIIADPTLELYKKYGIEESTLGMFKAMINPLKMMRVMFSGYFNIRSINDKPIIPADFLIDEDFKIHKAYYGKDFGDHIPLQDILRWD